MTIISFFAIKYFRDFVPDVADGVGGMVIVRWWIVLDDLATAESLMFELGVLEAATNNFSDDQKLGQGGFGSVYKGTLPNGQEIAVKRLSKISSQGVEEFKNEVVLIANLQHRNLVRLLGFCLAGDEKLLVYEFVPNKSLNYFLFDFGLARIFKVEQTEDNTNRVVGTYGYMAPEYAMHGHFSIKSDVFSFGVLILEIISGKKITERFHPSGPGDLLTHAWNSFTQQNLMLFMDSTLRDSYLSEEVMRCLHFGLLCAQDNTNDRPTMSTIVHILNSDSTTTAILATPQCPRSFYSSSTESSMVSRLSPHSTTITSSSNGHSKPISENQDTVSDIYPR
ncbi:Cysteine-rich receptor-like protein kinase 4 [Bienertia sinuspersici]